MLVQYFTVQPNGRDFQGSVGNGTITNGVQSALGPNGRPVVTAANPLLAQDFNTVTRELLWWTPTTSSNLNVVTNGSQILQSNSFSSNAFYPTNANGVSNGNNANGFRTAIFSGTFDLASAQSVNFMIGSDDDAFLFVDGTARVQNGGIHGITTQSNNVSLTAGSHTFQLFYADRQQQNAELTFSLPSNITITSSVPEPATWAMMIAGFGLVGGTMRRRSTKIAFA